MLGDYVLYRDTLCSTGDELITSVDLPILEPNTLFIHTQQKSLGLELKGEFKVLYKRTEEGSEHDTIAVKDPSWP
jgi:hypothetical protein